MSLCINVDKGDIESMCVMNMCMYVSVSMCMHAYMYVRAYTCMHIEMPLYEV